jgi:pilus assembly protein CpaC
MLINPRTQPLRGIALHFVALMMCALSIAAHAQGFTQEASINVSFATPPKEPVPVYVLAGQSALIVFDDQIGRLAVSNTDIAEAVLVAPNQMMVNGKVSGRARFTAWSKDTTQFVFFDVDVRVNLAQIDSQVRALFPNMDIRLSQANGAVVISGNVPNAVMAQVDAVVKAAGYKTVNLAAQAIEDVPQVQMQVKVAEVQRNKLNEYAYSPMIYPNARNAGSTNTGRSPFLLNDVGQSPGRTVGFIESVTSGMNLFFFTNGIGNYLRALQTQGALRALAEPNLVAMDGKDASFLAGGEIPVPVVQATGGGQNQVTIVWKEYGVRLNFKPQILDEQHIRLTIEPEVSTLDFAAGVDFGGFRIPALRVRRVKTSIELQNGQTFGIAGLLDNNETKSLSRIPVIADVPIIGNLFKSKSFQKNETEIVFIVTTNLIKPWNPDQVPSFKGVEGIRNGSPLGTKYPDPPKAEEDNGEATDAEKKPLQPVAAPTEGDANPPAEAPANTGAPAESGTPVPTQDGTSAPSAAGAESPAAPNAQPSVAPSNTSSPSATPTENAPEKVPSAAPTTSNSKPTTKRINTPDKGVHALQWKLQVPATATVTAQTRP